MAKKRRLKEKRNRAFSAKIAKDAREKKQEPARATIAKKQRNHGSSSFMANLFVPTDDVLLVGEGDLSFSSALLQHFYSQNLRSIHATTYDDQETLLKKYPQAGANVELLEKSKMKVSYGIDARKLDQFKKLRSIPYFPISSSIPHDGSIDEEEDSSAVEAVFSGSSGTSKRRGGEFLGYTKIIFNFPHTGGLSTSVRHQTRHNQALIVDFFTSAKKLLRPNDGRIIVTLFTGQPYEMWGIRDLARHCGLVVESSGIFDNVSWSQRGYRHARTMGNVVSKDGKRDCEGYRIDGKEDDDEGDGSHGVSDDESERKDSKAPIDTEAEKLAKHRDEIRRPGSWRGEERSARTYIFSLPQQPKPGNRGKRKKDDQTDSSSESA